MGEVHLHEGTVYLSELSYLLAIGHSTAESRAGVQHHLGTVLELQGQELVLEVQVDPD